MKIYTVSLIASPFVRLSGLLLATVLLSSPALARERSSTFTGPQGQTATAQSSHSQGQASGSVTGPQGQTATRAVARTASSTTATVTGPQGQSATRVTNRSQGSQSTTWQAPARAGTP